MRSAFRFLARWHMRGTLAPVAAFAVVSYVGMLVPGLEFACVYFSFLPMLSALFLLIAASTDYSHCSNIALSMGCRRKDLFQVSHWLFLLGAIGCGALCLFAAVLPEWIGLPYPRGEGSVFSEKPYFADPVKLAQLMPLLLLVQPIGAAAGVSAAYGNKKFLRFAYLIVASLALVAVSLCFSVLTTLGQADNSTVISIVRAIFWGGYGIAALLAVFCEVYFYRYSKTVAVC